MINYIVSAIIALALSTGGWFGLQQIKQDNPSFGAPLNILKVQQGGTGASTLSGCLEGNGTGPITGTGSPCGSGGGAAGSISTTTPLANTQVVFSTGVASIGNDSAFTYNAASDRLTVSYASTTALTASGNIQVPLITANSSAGIIVEANNGTDVAILGAGNTANSTFYGGVNIDGATRLATSLTGLLKATAGAITTASSGTDYEVPLTFSTGLTRTVNTVTVNTSQNIATLSNLTSNGFVKTSGGTGALSIDTSTYLTAITGGTCTNQFVRVVSTAGAITCATVANTDLANSTISGISLGSNLADLTATNATITFSGTYNGSTARTIGLNLGNANTWTVNQTFNYSSSTVYSSFVTASSTTSFIGTLTGAIISATQRLVTVIAAAFTPATEGEIGIDTTANQLKYYSGGAVRVVSPTLYSSFTYATSTAYTGTTTIPLGPAFVAETWTGVQCFTDAGTVNVSFYDGTNRMNMFNASTTVGTVTLSTNNTWTAGEKRYVDIGTPASSPTKVSCTVSKTIDSN